MPPRAVLDPNVLISAAISPRGAPRELIHAWRANRFELVVSEELLYELQAILSQERFRSYLSFVEVLEYVLWLHDRARGGRALGGVLRAEVSTRAADPDDAYLLNLAVSTVSGYLVSGDAHLLELGEVSGTLAPPSELREPLGSRRDVRTTILSPRQFLEELGG